ncbi:MAG TPA: serine hydrolase domain-containing protein [Gemmatimonadales bacterium]|nr:serine hydrolase domain-containing protein [Gemmatimonadales bacterium]
MGFPYRIGVLLTIATPLLAQSDSTARRGPSNPAEIEAFVDGMMLVQLRTGHAAGATVAVVRDGKLLFEKGYGYADLVQRTPVDAEQTLFRVGSVSKVFTWTAVMQLWEEGKLDLDKDVNEYLDFKIPATYPEPVTLRQILVHSAGFEEDPTDLFTEDTAHIQPMGTWLAAHMPARVRPPRVLTSYSNWTAAVAGYIVQRVSGIPFEEYVEQHIFTPLGMTRSTFRQPIPAALLPGLSIGYEYKHGRYEPKLPEYATGVGPAGTMATTAGDMAKFMISQLALGAAPSGRILAESTAVLMHSRLFGGDPRLPGFAYGFYEMSSNNIRVFGHGGDTQWFHSNMALLPSEGVGLFVSFNTDTGGAMYEVFTRAFMDHYYPDPLPWVASKATREELARFAGNYVTIRSNYSKYLKALSLALATTVTVADSGGALVTTFQGEEHRFIPVDSLLFRDENSELMLAFRKDSAGRITHAFLSNDPSSSEVKMSATKSPRLHLEVMATALVLFLLTVIAAMVRRLTGRDSKGLPDRKLLVAMASTFLLAVVVLAMMPISVQALLYNQLGAIRYLLILAAIGGLLTLWATIAAVRQWRSGASPLMARLRFTVVVLAAIAFLWSLNTWNLLGWKL